MTFKEKYIELKEGKKPEIPIMVDDNITCCYGWEMRAMWTYDDKYSFGCYDTCTLPLDNCCFKHRRTNERLPTK